MTDTGYNDTFSRPAKDLGGVPALCACPGEAAAWRGYDAVKLAAACGIPGPEKGLPGGVANTASYLKTIYVVVLIFEQRHGFL